MTKLSTVPYAYKPGLITQAIGGAGGPRGRERLRCKVIAYVKNRARLLSCIYCINSLCTRAILPPGFPSSQ